MTSTGSGPGPADDATLPRVLGPVEAVCVIVGSVIGSGIFIVPATVARNVPFLGGIALVWVVGGIFSAAGALTLAELGAMRPHAGGPYVYLKAAYGKLPAFLYGWTELLVIRTGAMATLAAAFARYFVQLVGAPAGLDPRVWQAGAAVAAIVAVAVVNVFGTRAGGRVQVVGTVLKVGGLLALMGLPVVVGGSDPSRLTPVWPDEVGWGLAPGVLVAMVAVLWTYDGWITLTPLAEDIRDPGRNLPRALIGGIVALIVLYLGATLAYHLVLPLDEVIAAAGGDEGGTSVPIAARYCRRLVGPAGVVAISALVMASTFIALNGNVLTGPRTYFAMARDGLLPARLARIHPVFRTPADAILAQAGWALVLTAAATALTVVPPPAARSGWPVPILTCWAALNTTPLYDLLFTYVIFGETLFYLLTVSSVFVLRVRRPDWPRPYRTWGYPVTPLVYIVASLLIAGSMLRQRPAESCAGLVVVLLGLPAYQFFHGGRPSRESFAGQV
jgi:APA family basic amino acid/polyamine antiporter